MRWECCVQAPVVVSAAVVSAVAMSAIVPAAQAAQEAFQMAEVSPLVHKHPQGLIDLSVVGH